jgi:hypothetical protein
LNIYYNELTLLDSTLNTANFSGDFEIKQPVVFEPTITLNRDPYIAGMMSGLGNAFAEKHKPLPLEG